MFLFTTEQFYFMCSQFNDAQKHFFSFIVTYVVKCKTGFKNKMEEVELFHVHFTGGVGVEKSFLINHMAQ